MLGTAVGGLVLGLLLSACGGSSGDSASGPSVPAGPAAPAVSPTPAGTPTPSGKADRSPGQQRPRPTPVPSKDSGPPTARHAALGADFALREGESIRIDGTTLVVTFTRLLEDSRCPADVTCIQAGQARIAVTLRQNGSPSTFELVVPATGGAEAPSNEQRLGRLVVHLESVDPSPTQPGTRTTHPTATLRVSRA